MADFLFLRKLKPDVLRYLPEFLQGDDTFKCIQEALNFEHELYRLKVADIARQFFLEEATWGLDDWERFLKIAPPATEEALRRVIIRTKRRADTVLTKANLQKLLDDYAQFGNASFAELGDNRLQLTLKNGNFHWDELLAALWENLPAHLVFNFNIDFDLKSPVIFAHFLQFAGDFNLDLSFKSPAPAVVRFAACPLFAGDCRVETAFNGDFSADVFAAFALHFFEDVAVEVDSSEFGDEEKRRIFDEYLKRRWQEFKNNAVVKHYSDDDAELEPGAQEFFPLERDFLRLYWKFGESELVRYTTHYDIKRDFSAADILKVSNTGEGILMHSRLPLPTTGILRALYVQKTETKIL